MHNSAWHMVTAQEIPSIFITIVAALVVCLLFGENSLEEERRTVPCPDEAAEMWEFIRMGKEPEAHQAWFTRVLRLHFSNTQKASRRERRQNCPVGPRRIETGWTDGSFKETDLSSIYPKFSKDRLSSFFFFFFLILEGGPSSSLN